MSEDHNHPQIPSHDEQSYPSREAHCSTAVATPSTKSATPVKNNKISGLMVPCNGPINSENTIATLNKNKRLKNTVSAHEASASEDEWRRDCQALTATKLKERYPATYQAFFAMKHVRSNPIAEGGQGAIIHDSVNTLPKFMRALGGPRRHAEMTVERLDYLDPEYAAGKIEWADKKQQARNRGTNSLVRNPRTNAWGPIAQIAEEIGIPAGTIRSALKRALDAEPDVTKHDTIRTYIVGDQLARSLRTGTSLPTGNTAPATPMPQKRTQPLDILKGWPVDMPKDKRDQWEQMLKRNRSTINDDGELEWPFEFYVRTLRGYLLEAGFRSPSLGYDPGRDLRSSLDKMMDAWRDPEEPTDAEWAAYEKVRDEIERCFARFHEAMAALPEFEAEARQRRRDRDKSFRRHTRNERVSADIDQEDKAMKDAEAYGSDEDEEEVSEPFAPDVEYWNPNDPENIREELDI
jgi:hypothetical protein